MRIQKQGTPFTFKRYNFNHPSNPFRQIEKQIKTKILHKKSADLNDGVLSCFEKKLKVIQRGVATPEKINVKQLSKELIALERALKTYSSYPCTANLNKDIFEHINYLLLLLKEWQMYFLLLTRRQRELSPSNELQYLKKIFKNISREAGIEIQQILKQIQEGRKKHFPATKGIRAKK